MMVAGPVLDTIRLGVLYAGAIWFRLVDGSRRESIDWVIGIEEIASVLHQLGEVVPSSLTVSMFPHPFYDYRYDVVRSDPRGIRGLWERTVRRPLLLARLQNRARGFVYVGRRGYLSTSGGRRAPEFRFLRRRGKRICCIFTGNDIRSVVRLEEWERAQGTPGLGSRYRQVNPTMFAPVYDAARRTTAVEAEHHADVIFTAALDQLSYFTRPTEPFLYLLPDEAFVGERRLFGGERPVVMHAPSSPVIKGTDAVRAAVQALRTRGYDFEYVELTGRGHDDVEHELSRADIVLNQFFALMPGMFGVEAMAAGCAVLMSADPRIEADLPADGRQAWIVTRVDEIESHLEALLDDHERAQRVASDGFEWAKRYASVQTAGALLNSILSGLLPDREPHGRPTVGPRAEPNEG